MENRDHAKEQARAQLDSIVKMVDRLEHCNECDGDECELSDQQIIEGNGYCYEEGIEASEEEQETYHDEDKARESIQEDPLSIQVRSGWANSAEEMEAEEFEILLCTGGPACRIIGDLDRGQPHSPRLQYQDWGTPWTEYFDFEDDEREKLLTFCEQFYFGE